MKKVILSYYWRIYCYQKAVDIYFLNTLEDERLQFIAGDCDYLITAGIQEKIPNSFIDCFKKWALNFHYALLPKHRGTFPVFWQKAMSDFEFGYTFHRITNNIDSGDILLQEKINLNPFLEDSAICDLLTRHASFQLHRLFDETLKGRAQNEAQASLHTMKEYNEVIHISFLSELADKVNYSKRWILNGRYVVHTGQFLLESETDGLIWKGLKLYLRMQGKRIELKTVNFLPAVFYFWPLKKLFAKQ